MRALGQYKDVLDYCSGDKRLLKRLRGVDLVEGCSETRTRLTGAREENRLTVVAITVIRPLLHVPQDTRDSGHAAEALQSPSSLSSKVSVHDSDHERLLSRDGAQDSTRCERGK